MPPHSNLPYLFRLGALFEPLDIPTTCGAYWPLRACMIRLQTFLGRAPHLSCKGSLTPRPEVGSLPSRQFRSSYDKFADLRRVYRRCLTLFSHHVQNSKNSVSDVSQSFLFSFALTHCSRQFQTTDHVAVLGLLLKGYVELHSCVTPSDAITDRARVFLRCLIYVPHNGPHNE